MNKRLERYAETVNAGLKRLPTDEREKEIAELKQHLEALTQARTELGDSEETAIEGAIQQFGHAPTIQRRLVAAYWRRRLALFYRSWPGAVVCTYCTVYLVYAFVPILLDQLIPYNVHNPNNNPTVLLWYSYTTLFFQCWLVGGLSCRLSGRRCLPVLAAIVMWCNLHCILPQIMRGPYSYEDWRLLLMCASSSLTLPFLASYVSLRRSPAFRKA